MHKRPLIFDLRSTPAQKSPDRRCSHASAVNERQKAVRRLCATVDVVYKRQVTTSAQPRCRAKPSDAAPTRQRAASIKHTPVFIFRLSVMALRDMPRATSIRTPALE